MVAREAAPSGATMVDAAMVEAKVGAEVAVTVVVAKKAVVGETVDTVAE